MLDVPLLALSRHAARADECPLSGVERTSELNGVMSANDSNPTLRRLNPFVSGRCLM